MTQAPASKTVALPRLILGLRRALANWWWVAPVAWLVSPSRLPPRQGWRWAARREVTLRLRDGSRARARLDEVFSFIEVYVLGEYDQAGIPWSEVASIVDVGAGCGAAALWMARRAPRARLLCVEPDPGAARRLRANIELGGLAERVDVVEAAVAASGGLVELLPGRTPSLTRVAPDAGPGRLAVRSATLTELIDAAGMSWVDLLKLDCEGGEFALLDELSLLRDRIGAIVGEWHDFAGDSGELLAGLEAAGYSVVAVPGDETGPFSAIRRARGRVATPTHGREKQPAPTRSRRGSPRSAAPASASAARP